VDTDIFVVGTPDAVIDLRTGKLATASGIITKKLGLPTTPPLAVAEPVPEQGSPPAFYATRR
jgi:hypothetical protein